MKNSTRSQARRAELERDLLELHRVSRTSLAFAHWLEELVDDEYGTHHNYAVELVKLYGEFDGD